MNGQLLLGGDSQQFQPIFGTMNKLANYISAQHVHDPFLKLTKSSILLYHACKVIVDVYFMMCTYAISFFLLTLGNPTFGSQKTHRKTRMDEGCYNYTKSRSEAQQRLLAIIPWLCTFHLSFVFLLRSRVLLFCHSVPF